MSVNIQQWRFDQSPDQTVGCIEQPTQILKADANARTVYVVDLLYDTVTQCFEIVSTLQPITAALADDPVTAEVVDTLTASIESPLMIF